MIDIVSYDTFEEAFRNLRPSEDMRVKSLADFGPSVVLVLQRIQRIHEKGCIVRDRHGLNSKEHLPEMLLGSLHKMRKGASTRVARRSGKMGGRPPKEDRMPDVEARAIWISPDYVTNEAALKHMPGWTLATAYKRLGPNGRVNIRNSKRTVVRQRKRKKR